MARTKIVATLGPATSDTGTIRQLIELGVDVFRVNFSHGTEAGHDRLIRNIRKASAGTPVAIMGDLTGPKLRCGIIPDGPVHLEKGKIFILTAGRINGSEKGVSVNYKGLPREVKRGEAIFLDDGNIELKVEKVRGGDIHCRIVSGGPLSSQKGINLPDTRLSLPALTRKDRDMIRFGVKRNLDFFALSFVKNAGDIRTAKRLVKKAGGNAMIIAKIERHEAIENLVEIVTGADGAMVARGDLGIEIPIQRVPIVQKQIIALCNELGKPVITATQMLESMIEKPRPTRAEVTDIANAILDGTDAVMLSGETAVGRHPLKAVQIMDTIAQSLEESLDYNANLKGRSLAEAGSVSDAVSLATCHIALSLDVAAILCCSATGYTARFVARYRPRCPILVFTPEPDTQRRLNLTWGVRPFLMKGLNRKRGILGSENMMKQAIDVAKEESLIRKGDRVVAIAGLPLGIGGTTNMLRVIEA